MNQHQKKTIMLTAIVALGIIILMSTSYYLGSQSKNERLESCHKALNALNDITNDIDVSVSEAADNVTKCDPTFK